MGAKDWMLAYCETDPRVVLRGRRPAIGPENTDPEDEPYPLPFHPLELAETALRELLGFIFEGQPHPDDADPFEIPLAGFAVS